MIELTDCVLLNESTRNSELRFREGEYRELQPVVVVVAVDVDRSIELPNCSISALDLLFCTSDVGHPRTLSGVMS